MNHNRTKVSFYHRKEGKPSEPPGLESERELISQLVENLKICIARFPQHYKSYYRLAKLGVRENDWTFVRKVLLNSQNKTTNILESISKESDNNVLKYQDLPALFGERSRTNFFAGIWRTPSGDIDRPGSFSRHLNRCCRLAAKCLAKLGQGSEGFPVNFNPSLLELIKKKP